MKRAIIIIMMLILVAGLTTAAPYGKNLSKVDQAAGYDADDEDMEDEMDEMQDEMDDVEDEMEDMQEEMDDMDDEMMDDNGAKNRARVKTQAGEADVRIGNENARERLSEVKVLPEQASETAKERVRFRADNVTLTTSDDEIPRVIYHIQGEKPGRFLGIFKIKARVEANVDAETGEVVNTNAPWWAFMVWGGDIEEADNETDNSTI